MSSGIAAVSGRLASLGRRRLLFRMDHRLDPSGFYQPRDHVLMLGAMVSDPAANLVGYEGSESTVVMGGFPVVLDP